MTIHDTSDAAADSAVSDSAAATDSGGPSDTAALPAEPGSPGVVVARLDDLEPNSMRLVRADGARLCLVRTSEGVFALDHACPHEGYGLTQGELSEDGLLTCAWHNWKFRVSDGECVLGEESVGTHDTVVDDAGDVRVTVRRPDPVAQRPLLLASLRRGIEKNYIGQVSRDVVRLLQASANPGELVWEAVAFGAPRSEFGWGHSVASATDCLSMLDLYEGDQRALPIVQGIAHVADAARDRPVQSLPAPVADLGDDPGAAFRACVEAEDLVGAQAMLRAAIHAGWDADALRPWFTAAVSDHHLSYGHGAIYAQKAFQLLDLIGWDRADTVLPYLVPTIVYGTREDKLPYMRPFVRALGDVDLRGLSEIEGRDEWADDGRLLYALLDGNDRVAPLAAAVDAIRNGAGIDGVLDVVVQAVSERMLRYDPAGERDFHDDFGWLDITHGITYANAVRWHAAHVDPHDPLRADAVRLALWTVFLAHWKGRHEWHAGVGRRAEVEPLASDLRGYGEALQRESLLDGTTAFIVHAHAVKTSVAATSEAVRAGTTLPLDATARFMSEPRLERFVAATVTRSIDFLSGRSPRDT